MWQAPLPTRKKPVGAIVGVVVGSLVLCFSVVGVVVYKGYHRNFRKRSIQQFAVQKGLALRPLFKP
jgi:hypothetical protein